MIKSSHAISPPPRNSSPTLAPSLSSPLYKTPSSRPRAFSESHLPSPKPLLTALKNAKRALYDSRRPRSGLVCGAVDDEEIESIETTHLYAGSGHGSHSESPNRSHERRSAFGFISGSSQDTTRNRSQTLTGPLSASYGVCKPVRPDRSGLEVDEDLIARPPPAISSSVRLPSKRALSNVVQPSPLAIEDNTDDIKTPTPASCVQFGSRAPPPQFTPRFIFEEFERAYRVEDELLRAQLADEPPSPTSPVTEPISLMDFDRERILRHDNLLSPAPRAHDHAGLGLAFPACSSVFRPDDPFYRTQPSPYLHHQFDKVDNTSPDHLESSSRMMKLFDNYLETTPKTGNNRSTGEQGTSSPGRSLRRICSHISLGVDHHSLSRTTTSDETFLRTPAFGSRKTTTSVSMAKTPRNARDERSPDSDDGADESPQTPFAGGLPAVRIAIAAEGDPISTPPRVTLESQLEKIFIREPGAALDKTPPARPRTPETERRSPFRLGAALGSAASRLTHSRQDSMSANTKARRPSDNTGWRHWPSASIREPREVVGRVLFDEESRGHGFGSLKQLIGLRRGHARQSATPIMAGPLLEDWSNVTSETTSRPIAPPVLASSPEDDHLSPRRAYGKRQGFWETGNWTRGDLNLRPPEPTPEDVADSLKNKQASKNRLLRRAARASASAARSAATGLGIKT